MNSVPQRLLNPLLTAVASFALLMLASPADAQLPTRSTMPDPVVLVVRTIDQERVQPTAGVVIGRSNTGERLVVVAADFVRRDGDLFVLDGGTDFTRDGLPASRENVQEGEALAVIAVPGLQRPALRVTFNPPESDHEVRLAAWPPAEMMAVGALPFWVPVNVAGTMTGEAQTLMPGENVPNLTGPLIDLCGQWAGMVIASGEPGTNAGEAPLVLLNDELLRIAQSLDIDLGLEACMQVAPVGSVVAPTTVPPERQEQGMISKALETANLGMGAIVFLLSAVISGIVFWALIKRRAATQRRQRMRRTLATETVTFSADGLPTRRTAAEPPTFNPGTTPPGSSGWLRIEGTHADGRPLRAVTAINEGKFQAVIGRAGVSLSADGPGISRKHAVIVGEGGLLTISDLGSRNGTFVNGVRCQKDEVFYIDENDKILLGAAEVTVRMSPVKG